MLRTSNRLSLHGQQDGFMTAWFVAPQKRLSDWGDWTTFAGFWEASFSWEYSKIEKESLV